jgi:hypothetical protein
MLRKTIVSAAVHAILIVTAGDAFAASSDPTSPPWGDLSAASTAPSAERRGFNPFPEHHFQWTATDAKQVQVGVNFGLLQLGLGGFNIAGEVRYRRFWFEYSHGVDLKLDRLGGFSMTSAERAEDLRLVVPYTTGFGVGVTLLDELWLGVELKTHRYEVNAPGGPVTSYQTYSVGPVLGYKLFVYKGLFANAYARYWPNVASTLDHNEIALRGANGTVEHAAHDFNVFANVSIGYAFDL